MIQYMYIRMTLDIPKKNWPARFSGITIVNNDPGNYWVKHFLPLPVQIHIHTADTVGVEVHQENTF